jgi:hypothetical protein
VIVFSMVMISSRLRDMGYRCFVFCPFTALRLAPVELITREHPPSLFLCWSYGQSVYLLHKRLAYVGFAH